MTFEELGLSRRTANYLFKIGIRTVEQLSQLSEYELYGIRGFGYYTVREIAMKMEEKGRKFKRI